jgi:hypothetical protein
LYFKYKSRRNLLVDIEKHIDGDLYEQRTSVLPNFSGEAKNLITSLRTKWESWNLEIWLLILPYIDINLKLRHKNNLKKFNFLRLIYAKHSRLTPNKIKQFEI